MAKASLKKSGNKGEMAVQFFKALRHTKGRWAGRPFDLLPWQEKIIRDLFGTLRPDGRRQYRTAYIEIPRKAGKSTLASGIALLLLFEGEPGAEVYSAAADRDQAAIVFEQAKAMIQGSPELARYAEVFKRSITVPRLGASYKVLSADAPTKHGLNAHGIIFDELHAQPNRELWDVLTTSTGAREQPLVVAITTAGYDRNSICWELHEYARKVLDGIIQDDTFYPVIYAADETDDWTDPVTWHKANPSLGVTVQEEYYRQECEKARQMPAYQNTFRRLLLNQWTGQETRWMDMAAWDATAGIVTPEELKGRDCFGGLDLASTTDIAAVVLLFPMDDGTYHVLPHFFIPEDTAREKEKRDRVPYLTWARQGFIHLTPGNVIDYTFIENKVRQLGQQYHVLEWAYDRWNADMLVQRLIEDGAKMIPVGMGYASLSAPTKHLEALVLSRQLVHGGNPVLRWMADNVMVEQDPAGNIKPSKAKSTQKIDGIVALILALSRAMLKQDNQSAYNTRELLVL